MRGRNLLSLLIVAAIVAGVSFAVAQQGGGPGPATTPTPASTPTPTAEGMVRVPGGSFMMGCVDGDSQCKDDEKPRHQVTLRSFDLDVHDVTVAEYAQCVNAGRCKEPSSTATARDQWADFYNWQRPGRENYPVNGVDWNDAKTYCTWRQKRLPKEAEFEYALRGGAQGQVYPWGDAGTPPPGSGNYADESAARHFLYMRQRADWWFHDYDDGFVGASPVCSFTRNAFGLCDISGNVLEWAADWYDKNYYRSSPPNNPPGPTSGSSRVLRGGSWFMGPDAARASYRGLTPPDVRISLIGFRCSRD
jgi:formylglycine-generating enzyme required for sulfatase activity